MSSHPGRSDPHPPVLADLPFKVKPAASTGVWLGETSNFHSNSSLKSSIFMWIEPVSVATGFELKSVILSVQAIPPG